MPFFSFFESSYGAIVVSQCLGKGVSRFHGSHKEKIVSGCRLDRSKERGVTRIGDRTRRQTWLHVCVVRRIEPEIGQSQSSAIARNTGQRIDNRRITLKQD